MEFSVELGGEVKLTDNLLSFAIIVNKTTIQNKMD